MRYITTNFAFRNIDFDIIDGLALIATPIKKEVVRDFLRDQEIASLLDGNELRLHLSAEIDFLLPKCDVKFPQEYRIFVKKGDSMIVRVGGLTADSESELGKAQWLYVFMR